MRQNWMGWTMTVVMAVSTATAGLVPFDAEAKRLGSGRSQGMQRSTPAQNTPTATPGTPAQQAPTNAAAAAPLAGGAAAAAAAPKRNWMGPIAGLAAGLGIAALMSHLGMGEAFGNFLMMALLAVAAIFLVRFLMRRFGNKGAASNGGGLQMAGAGAGAGGNASAAPFGFNAAPNSAANQPMQRSSFDSGATNLASGAPVAGASQAFASQAFASQAFASQALAPASPIPADFDSAGFERIAKMIFIRMQTANDSGDLNDLRNFTTPEMFASIRLDLQDRGNAKQTTDVLKVDAEVLEVVQEADSQVVSVRFHGLVREESESAASDFDEVWHLVKPTGDDNRAWAIAGIQQRS